MTDRPLIVGLGEVLWDVFPDARHFGGAPANVAVHANELGGRGALASAVGRDPLGTEAREIMAARLLDTSGVADSAHPTGTVTVQLDEQGKADYVFAADTAWDHLAWSGALAVLAREADAVVFGTLGQRCEESRKTIQRFLAAVKPGCLRVFDVNLRQSFFDNDIIAASLTSADMLKLNDEELPIVFPGATAGDLPELRRRHGLRLIALTCGGEGALLVGEDEISDLPGEPIEVKDTVGAGDSFTAATIMGLLGGHPLPVIHRHAAAVAGYVCSQAGATPALPESLKTPDTFQ